MNKLLFLIAFLLMIPMVYSVGSIELPARMEYKTGEVMTLYAQVLNESSKPVENATCTITIYYPNRTVWVDNKVLTHLSDDLYYYQKTLPDTKGVFVYEINCTYPVVYGAEIFHAGSEWTEEISEIENEVSLLDDIKDNTDKIPLIRNTLSFLTVNLQNLGITQRNSFLTSIAILVFILIIIGIAIIVFIWRTLKVGFFEKKETEEEAMENEGFI